MRKRTLHLARLKRPLPHAGGVPVDGALQGGWALALGGIALGDCRRAARVEHARQVDSALLDQRAARRERRRCEGGIGRRLVRADSVSCCRHGSHTYERKEGVPETTGRESGDDFTFTSSFERRGFRGVMSECERCGWMVKRTVQLQRCRNEIDKKMKLPTPPTAPRSLKGTRVFAPIWLL